LDDRQFIRDLVRNNNALALNYASQRLRNDREFVFYLIHFKKHALKYTSDDVKNDLVFAKRVFEAYPSAIAYFHSSVFEDKELIISLAIYLRSQRPIKMA